MVKIRNQCQGDYFMMNVNVTYIGHSGFLLEWDRCCWLMDWSSGQIPRIDGNKMLVVFVSHSHGDHFNPDIFKIFGDRPNTWYVLSSDININERSKTRYGITDEMHRNITIARPDGEFALHVGDGEGDGEGICISTLKSTDCGVAFLIRYNGYTVYHAGDLNLWMWPGESKQYNNDMKARFDREMLRLKGLTIDIAFAPLDPRQEEWYRLGMDALLETAEVKHVFPMHMWGKYDTIARYKKASSGRYDSIIMDVKYPGQSWSL
jgi:L-ascorbate metabolism protein UlaG (beta-lactamase superfamily)